jgi:hypothetical protein
MKHLDQVQSQGGPRRFAIAITVAPSLSSLTSFALLAETAQAAGTIDANMSPQSGNKAYAQASGAISCSISAGSPWVLIYNGLYWRNDINFANYDSIIGSLFVELHAPGWFDEAYYSIDVYHDWNYMESKSGSTQGDWSGWVSTSVWNIGQLGGQWRFVVSVWGLDSGSERCRSTVEFDVADGSPCSQTADINFRVFHGEKGIKFAGLVYRNGQWARVCINPSRGYEIADPAAGESAWWWVYWQTNAGTLLDSHASPTTFTPTTNGDLIMVVVLSDWSQTGKKGGYIDSGTFTRVSGRFQIPYIGWVSPGRYMTSGYCGAPNDYYDRIMIMVGIGGFFGTGDYFMAGVEILISATNVYFVYFYWDLGRNPVANCGLYPRAGDTIEVIVSYQNGNIDAHINDLSTSGQNWAVAEAYTPDTSTVAWVAMPRAYTDGSNFPLPSFGSIQWSACTDSQFTNMMGPIGEIVGHQKDWTPTQHLYPTQQTGGSWGLEYVTP